MKRARTVGLMLVVLVASSAVGISTASAEPPEFGRCVKVAKATGKFSSATCTVEKVGGSFEWTPGPGANNKFTFAGSGRPSLETPRGIVNCQAGGSGTGEYAGPKTVGNVVLTLEGCETGIKCGPHGNGRIVFNTLDGALGIIKMGQTPKQDKIGLDLSPPGEAGPVVEFSCAGEPFVLRGSVIDPVTAKKMQLTSSLKFSERRGKQKPEQFEGQPKDILEASVNGNAFEQAGLALEATQTNEEPIEINSVF